LTDLEELATELWDPARLSIAGIGPDEQRFEEALADLRAITEPGGPTLSATWPPESPLDEAVPAA
jgi:hypothetical protein